MRHSWNLLLLKFLFLCSHFGHSSKPGTPMGSQCFLWLAFHRDEASVIRVREKRLKPERHFTRMVHHCQTTNPRSLFHSHQATISFGTRETHQAKEVATREIRLPVEALLLLHCPVPALQKRRAVGCVTELSPVIRVGSVRGTRNDTCHGQAVRVFGMWVTVPCNSFTA